MDKKKLSLATIISYAFATGSGYQIMGSLVGSYLLIFLTDTFGVPAGAAGIIMVVASIWDAINDPIMGTLADRTKTKWGKYRPYFLCIPALLTVVVVLLFASPDISTHGKIIWTAVFYILYGMLRTGIEIPSYALINAVTDQPEERTKLIDSYTVVMGIFTTITTSFALTFVSIFGGDNTAKGYMIVVGFAGVLMTISCWICFALTREKYVEHTVQDNLLGELKKLFSTKGLVNVILSWLASYVAFNLMMASSVYYIMYVIMRPDLISVYMLDISLVGVVGIVFLIPALMKIFKKTEKAFAASQVLVIICSACVLILKNSIVALFVFSGIGAMFATASMPFSAMLMTEMIDLVKLEKNRTVNGTMAALKGFCNKAGIAISSAIISFSLEYTGYIAGAIGQEPQAVLMGISISRFVVPIICAIVVIVSVIKYPVTDEKRLQIKRMYETKEGVSDEKKAC